MKEEGNSSALPQFWCTRGRHWVPIRRWIDAIHVHLICAAHDTPSDRAWCIFAFLWPSHRQPGRRYLEHDVSHRSAKPVAGCYVIGVASARRTVLHRLTCWSGREVHADCEDLNAFCFHVIADGNCVLAHPRSRLVFAFVGIIRASDDEDGDFAQFRQPVRIALFQMAVRCWLALRWPNGVPVRRQRVPRPGRRELTGASSLSPE